MKHTLLTVGMLILSAVAFAQDSENDDEYELSGKEKHGYIITKDDKKIEGIVKLVGSATTPWKNQKKVKFLALEDIDQSKKRQKFKKLDADDMKEYVAVDDSTERHFRMIKFVNAREGLTSGNGVGAKIKMIKNLSSTTHMAEVIIDGPITMYRLYGYPAVVAAGNADVAEAEAATEKIINNPDILFQKGADSKPKELSSSDIKKLVEDCEVVANKLASGEYNTYDPAKEEKKKSGMGKLIKGELDRGGDKLLNMGVQIFGDYNATCNK